MTLPDEEVLAFLDENFVLGTKNIQKELHVGMSHGYSPKQSAVGTTNGAGGRNVQFIVMAADETVLHVLPGFWHKEDLLAELRLALEIDKLYRSDSVSMRRKLEMLPLLHQAHLRRHGDDEQRRGDWQSFDRQYEVERVAREPRDTFYAGADGVLTLKSIPEVVHERMIAHPFEKLAEFDLESFVDYGRPYYDNNWGDRGKEFGAAKTANKKREKELEKERKAAAKQAEKDARAAARADRAASR